MPIPAQLGFNSSRHDFDPHRCLDAWCITRSPVPWLLGESRWVWHPYTILKDKRESYAEVPWLELIDHRVACANNQSLHLLRGVVLMDDFLCVAIGDCYRSGRVSLISRATSSPTRITAASLLRFFTVPPTVRTSYVAGKLTSKMTKCRNPLRLYVGLVAATFLHDNTVRPRKCKPARDGV